MEYPFKDLMPLDEVLEREGYYKDWTHLDPKVFYSLTQISEYIRTKGFGVDVRLLIAQLAEHFSLKTSQINEIERLFKGVMKELSEDKDFYSLPEIAWARGGFGTLGERLDDTTTQLAKKVGSGTKAELEDLSPTVISAIEGGEGTSFDLLSVPQDYSVTSKKISNQLQRDIMYKPITNLISNGNFESLENWDIRLQSGTVNNNILTVELIDHPYALAASWRISQELAPIPGHLYYISAHIKPKYKNLTYFSFGANSLITLPTDSIIPDEWNKLSGIVTSGNDTTIPFRITHSTNTNYQIGDTIDFKYMLAIDLTEHFGSGNEPSEEEIESALARHPNSWFDGSTSMMTMTEVVSSINEKEQDRQSLLNSGRANQVLTSNGDGTVSFKTPSTSELEIPTLESSSGRSSTVTVAAFNSEVKSRAYADYVCTGTKDEKIINQALTYGAGGKVTLLEGDYNISNPIEPPSDTDLEIIGKIRLADSVTTTLIADAPSGQPNVTVADGSLYNIGDWVACYDDDSETQKGGGGQTRKHANCGKITEINGNTLTLNGSLPYSLTVVANAVLGTIPSIILIDEKENINVYGKGELDGNKINQFDCDPVRVGASGEEVRAGCCISIKNSTNIKVDRITAKKAILHNIVSMLSENTKIKETICLEAHDKNMLYLWDTNFRAINNICNDAEYEDGLIGYSNNVGAVLQGNHCEGNNRYGISTGDTDQQCTTLGNTAKNNGTYNIKLGAKKASSNGDQSTSFNGGTYAVVINGEDVTVNGLNVFDNPDSYGCLFIYGSYVRMYGGSLQALTTGTGLARGITFGPSSGRIPSHVDIDGIVIRDSKTGVHAEPGITNCKVRNHYLVDVTTDVTDNSNGQLIMS